MCVNITFLHGLRSPPNLRGHHLPFTQNCWWPSRALLSSSPFSSGMLAAFELHFLTCRLFLHSPAPQLSVLT